MEPHLKYHFNLRFLVCEHRERPDSIRVLMYCLWTEMWSLFKHLDGAVQCRRGNPHELHLPCEELPWWNQSQQWRRLSDPERPETHHHKRRRFHQPQESDWWFSWKCLNTKLTTDLGSFSLFSIYFYWFVIPCISVCWEKETQMSNICIDEWWMMQP